MTTTRETVLDLVGTMVIDLNTQQLINDISLFGDAKKRIDELETELLRLRTEKTKLTANFVSLEESVSAQIKKLDFYETNLLNIEINNAIEDSRKILMEPSDKSIDNEIFLQVLDALPSPMEKAKWVENYKQAIRGALQKLIQNKMADEEFNTLMNNLFTVLPVTFVKNLDKFHAAFSLAGNDEVRSKKKWQTLFNLAVALQDLEHKLNYLKGEVKDLREKITNGPILNVVAVLNEFVIPLYEGAKSSVLQNFVETDILPALTPDPFAQHNQNMAEINRVKAEQDAIKNGFIDTDAADRKIVELIKVIAMFAYRRFMGAKGTEITWKNYLINKAHHWRGPKPVQDFMAALFSTEKKIEYLQDIVPLIIGADLFTRHTTVKPTDTMFDANWKRVLSAVGSKNSGLHKNSFDTYFLQGLLSEGNNPPGLFHQFSLKKILELNLSRFDASNIDNIKEEGVIAQTLRSGERHVIRGSVREQVSLMFKILQRVFKRANPVVSQEKEADEQKAADEQLERPMRSSTVFTFNR